MFKIKKGSKETYVQDESELDNLILENSVNELISEESLKMNKISSSDLLKNIGHYRRYQTILKLIERQ